MKIQVNSTINNNQITVDTSHTLFVNLFNINLISENHFKSNLKLLKKKFKQSKTRFYTKNALDLLKQYDSYKNEVEKYNSIFLEIKTLWEEIVSEGIYAPTIENVKMSRVAKIRAELESMVFRSTIISKFINLNYEMEKYLKSESEYVSVRL